jgi:hypothetical protein
VSEEFPVLIDCVCGGSEDCANCDGNGRFELSECPRSVIGQDLTECINYASLASKGSWPVVGGVLDQSAWFVALVQKLEAETSLIDAARMERM